MVADAQQQPQPTTAEDEAVKRNTDCVYFLASPLTCKKGSECEYRHSEYARVNPRDCWYWLNSACLNPKCAFRHPPIEGLLGVQAPQSAAGFPVPSAQTIVAPETPSTQSSAKQPVTCVFFQKGYCMKGDKCSFLHGPNPPPTSAKPAQAPSNPPQGIESSNAKKVFSGGLQKCSQEQKLPHVNMAKSVVGAQPPSHRADPISKPLTLLGNGFGIERGLLPIKPFDDEHSRAKTVVPPPMNNGVPANHRPSRVSGDHGFHNGKEADEFMRESSPGFDVLVEDELRDEEYFHGEDRQYGRLRRLDVDDEYDMDRPVSAADVDPDRFRDQPRGFEPRIQGQYDSWDPRRDRDRKPIGPPQFDRRGYRKSISPDNTEGVDLRQQLSKNKRVNGLRSSIDRYDVHERHSGDDRSHRSSRRDSQPAQQHKGPLSSRLRGRINFGLESRVDRELDRPRSSRGRISPKRPQTSSSSSSTYEGRFRDRLKGRVSDEVRNGRSSRDGREIVNYEGIADLSAPPKGLTEVRRGGAENKEPSILGKRKIAASQQPAEAGSGDVSFDGPMPLSEILKRKREASEREKSAANTNKQETGLDREEGEVGEKGESSKHEGDDVAAETMDDEKIVGDPNELEVGDGVTYDEAAVDDQDLDQAHGDYEYEEEEEEEVEEVEEDEEGEYEVEGEEEYLEDEEDDFAKKIGVLSS